MIIIIIFLSSHLELEMQNREDGTTGSSAQQHQPTFTELFICTRLCAGHSTFTFNTATILSKVVFHQVVDEEIEAWR